MLDYFGKDASELKHKKLWLLDLDGTIYKEDRLFDGALELLQWIEDSGGKYVFITNNSSKSVTEYMRKVNKFGIKADENNFFTSIQATVLWLEQNHPGKRIYCQGTKSFVEELKNAGIDVTEEVKPVDVVLVGFDMELTTDKLRNTCEILSTQEVEYIATNCDLVCPVGFGYIPDCGSMCQMLKNATGKWPMFIGKPEPTMLNIVRSEEGKTTEETVIIGDRLYTDIYAGISAGVTTICVLTGETTVGEVMESTNKPDYTFLDLKQITVSIT